MLMEYFYVASSALLVRAVDLAHVTPVSSYCNLCLSLVVSDKVSAKLLQC